MSRLTTKPTKWLCAQRRLRSAWASAQSDQSSLCAQWVAKDPSFLHADSEDWSDRADAQADLSLRWAHSHIVGFVMRRLILVTVSAPCKSTTRRFTTNRIFFTQALNDNHSTRSKCSAFRWQLWYAVKLQIKLTEATDFIFSINYFFIYWTTKETWHLVFVNILVLN